MDLRNIILPKCPVCGAGNWPKGLTGEGSKRCRICKAEIRDNDRRQYIARLVLLLGIFFFPAVVVSYVRSTGIIVAIWILAAIAYLKISKFECATEADDQQPRN